MGREAELEQSGKLVSRRKEEGLILRMCEHLLVCLWRKMSAGEKDPSHGDTGGI